MAKPLYPAATVAMAPPGRQCAQEINGGVRNHSGAAFAEGALSEKTKQLIAVVVNQWPPCITAQTKLARRRGASSLAMMEAIGAASQRRPGAPSTTYCRLDVIPSRVKGAPDNLVECEDPGGTYRAAMLFTVQVGREENYIAHLNPLRAAGQTGEIKAAEYPTPVPSVPRRKGRGSDDDRPYGPEEEAAARPWWNASAGGVPGDGAATTTDHKVIGNMYFVTSLAYFSFAGVLALAIRAELAFPGLQFLHYETYNQFFTMHGTLMLLMFATPLFVAFANAIMPLQIGALMSPFRG